MDTVPESLNSASTQTEAEAPQPASGRTRHQWVLLLLANARWIWPLLVLSIVVWISWSDLRAVHFREVRHAIRRQDPGWFVVAAGLTVLNLALMGLYDVICLRGSNIRPKERWWIGSLAFAWSNFLTLGPLAGPAIRFWLYRPSGVTFALLRQVIVAISVGFGTGLVIWLGVVHIPLPGQGPWTMVLRIVIASIAGYALGRLAGLLQRWKSLPVWVRELKVTWTPLFLLGVFDWLTAFFVFAAVLRMGGIFLPSGPVLRYFFLGQGVGLLSLLPGGLGSADAFWLSALDLFDGQSAAFLVLYRVLYYLLPWCAATLILLRRAVHSKVRWAGPARVFVSLLVVLSGVVMLVSAATPALAHRMRILREFLPLGLLETSHVASAIVGLLLLVLARGIVKGYRSAYKMTLALLVTGFFGSLLKGLDYEEATIMALTAALLWTHSRLFTLPSRPGGTVVAVLTPVALSLFIFTAIGLTAFSAGTYTSSLWLHFEHFAYHGRFLRTLSVLFLLGLTIAVYFVQRIPHSYTPPTHEELTKALEIHRKVGKGTYALMVLNGDKSIHFWQDRGFCLYRTIGQYMFVFSDPSIPPGAERTFLSSLLQKAAELDRSLAFYQISSHWIPVLHDFGYAFFKLGEEAIVELEKFNIQGNKGKAMRNVLNRFRNDGYSFSVVSKEDVSALTPDLQRVSDNWLHSKKTREKQFSIGFFDPRYLCSLPCAIVRNRAGEIVAFSNILAGHDRSELSVDLMRYLPECPNGVMDLLFLKLFEWGKQEGFKTFNLGMAPLATVGDVRQARLQERLANVLFEHGENWYNFRGLRQFKEKFDPLWVPRYLAYPSFWRWMQVLANVTALISGGWKSLLFPVGIGVHKSGSVRPQVALRIGSQS